MLGRVVLTNSVRDVPYGDLVVRDEYYELGLTDAAVIELARQGALVLTHDERLAVTLGALGLDVLDFEHLRETMRG